MIGRPSAASESAFAGPVQGRGGGPPRSSASSGSGRRPLQRVSGRAWRPQELGCWEEERYQVIAKGNVISLVPDKPVSTMRGFVRGIKTTGFREKKDRF
jgi:hypothetical protein